MHFESGFNIHLLELQENLSVLGCNKINVFKNKIIHESFY